MKLIKNGFLTGILMLLISLSMIGIVQAKEQIIHDAEHYLLEAQHEQNVTVSVAGVVTGVNFTSSQALLK